MGTNFSIILEPANGTHNLKLGEYYLDLELNVLYVGIGTFGQGGGGGVTPVGNIIINQNGEYDVTLFKNAIVEVTGSASGTEVITANGIYDIASKAFVDVRVEAPTETVTITQNGTYNVVDKATAIVAVQSNPFGFMLTEDAVDNMLITVSHANLTLTDSAVDIMTLVLYEEP